MTPAIDCGQFFVRIQTFARESRVEPEKMGSDIGRILPLIEFRIVGKFDLQARISRYKMAHDA